MASPEIQQLSQELQQLTRALQGMVSAASRTAQAQQAQFEHMLDINDQLSDYRKSLTAGRKLNKDEQKLLTEAIRLKKEEIVHARRLQKAQNDLEVAMKNGGLSSSELQKRQTAVAKATKVLGEAQIRTTTVSSQLQTGLASVNKGSMVANAGLVFFGRALRQQATQLLAQNTAAAGVVEGTNTLAGALLSQQNLGLQYQLAGSELAELTAQNRQLVNSFGSSAATLEETKSTIDRFRIATGSMVEGAHLAMAAATELAKKGIRPSTRALEAYTADIVQLQTRTGLSARMAMDYFNEIASEADSIELLRRSRAGEREALLANQRALVNQALQLGMTAEQAKEAAKMLNKMVAAKPLDRLKQAAKVRALGGAMGIAGANEAADGIAAGSRATAEQREAMQTFATAMANRVDQAASEGMATEIFATTLVDKLGLEQYFGAGNAFSTSLGDTLKPAFSDLSKQYIDVAATAEGKAALRLAELVAQTKLLVSGNHWAGVIAGAVVAIAGLMMGGKVAGMVGRVASGIGNAGKGILGGLGGAAGGAGAAAKTGAAATAVGGASRFGALASTAGTVLKGAGVVGSVIDVGSGLTDLAQGKAQKELPQGFEKLSPMKWGMFIGDKINQGVEGVIGQSIGSKLYDVFNPSAEVDAKTVETTAAIKDTSTKTADAVTTQVKKMDTSNDLLKQIADLTKKQTDLAEKQLVALTMTEKERSETAARTNLRADNRFGSQYGYV